MTVTTVGMSGRAVPSGEQAVVVGALDDPARVVAAEAHEVALGEVDAKGGVLGEGFLHLGYELVVGVSDENAAESGRQREGTAYYHHVGIYSYRRQLLLKWRELPPSQLELTEELEQLRALENGYKIKVGITKYRSVDVNTFEDLEKIKEVLCQNTSS